jgi:hypothetical protein
VPEPLGDNLERLAACQRRCCIAVPDAVQGHRRQAGVVDQAGEPLGDVLGVEDLAVLAGKDRAAVVNFTIRHHVTNGTDSQNAGALPPLPDRAVARRPGARRRLSAHQACLRAAPTLVVLDGHVLDRAVASCCIAGG